MSYFIRYFADQSITSKQISHGLQQYDGSFKIDLGDLIRGEAALGQIEVNQAGGDMFKDDLQHTLQLVHRRENGDFVAARLRASKAIVVVAIDFGERGTDATMDMVSPLWAVLASLSSGLSQWDGSGIFEGATQLVDLAR